MKTKTILVPTDFSQHSKMVLRYAESLARDREAKLLIVHVKEPPPYFPPASHGVEDSGRGEENELLAKVIPSDPAIRYAHRMLVGDPADEIVRLANKKRVEMIVMATHGRTGLSRLLMGRCGRNGRAKGEVSRIDTQRTGEGSRRCWEREMKRSALQQRWTR